MEKSIYKPGLYPTRPINNLKTMLDGSAALYANQTAFLVKDRPGGDYLPVSFRKLREYVDALGTALLDLGLAGKKIAVIGENRLEWVLTYLAVTNGVGIICPLDRELPAGEIHHLLVRAGVSAVVYSGKVESAVLEALDGVDTVEHRISMDAIAPEEDKLSLPRLLRYGRQLMRQGDMRFSDAVIDPDAICTLLFTSGTTGLAKGVMLSHRNIASNVEAMSKVVSVYGFTGLSILPMHHCYELTCHVMTALYQGCTVAICEGLKYIVKNITEANVNVVVAVPLIFESMHKKLWKQAEKSGKAEKMRRAVNLAKNLGLNKGRLKPQKKLFKQIHQALGGDLKLLIAGAAAIDPSVVEDFNAMGFNMIQGYGMTECSPIIAVNMDNYSKAGSAGLPLPGTEVRIDEPDENGIGEIICRGPSVMLGYYNDPEETARVLREGWLYTGDYGYLDKDGFLYVTGRKKNVIVTKNGKNIFPEEVEFYLSKHDYISEVMVYGLEEEKTGDTIVCAEIFPNFSAIEQEKGQLSEKALHSLLKGLIDAANDQMPPYKRVRRFYIRYTDFEKTTTHKIKRHLANAERIEGKE
ncbi:MAG: AMP-binding protein [Bacillota bacterium]|nr:AMP-binding protein [Bacillota bacterium]